MRRTYTCECGNEVVVTGPDASTGPIYHIYCGKCDKELGTVASHDKPEVKGGTASLD